MEKKIILFTINRKRISKKLKSDINSKAIMIIANVEELKKELTENSLSAVLIDGSLDDQIFLNSLIAVEQAIKYLHLDIKIFFYKEKRKIENIIFLKDLKELRNYL